MIKISVLAISLAIMAAFPAYSQDLCNDAHMKQMDEIIARADLMNAESF